MRPYKTLKQAASDSFIVNKSRFIGHATPASTEEAALDFLAAICAQYRDATHNCYAYIVGENAGIMRYSDDGEPGGTAGMPIIECRKARGVVNCCVVVTRYCGGVLLGAGGLVRAYSRGCALALDAAQVVVMQPTARWWIEIEYPLWDRVSHMLANEPVQMESTEFSATVNASLLVRKTDEAALLQKLSTLTDGRAETLLAEELHHQWPEEAQQDR